MQLQDSLGRDHGFGTTGSALVMVEDERSALAAVLILQEMGLAVDVATDHEAALSWVRLARYRVVVAGTKDGAAELALRLRYAAPRAQVIMLASASSPADGLDELGVDVLRPPVNVNALIERLMPLSAA